jgi:glycosyltransferase involved in cell wall biosynthesis
MVSHAKVQELMNQSDILFFPSIVEGTPHVVLEALSNGLPVLCHDCAGQGEIVDSTCGYKILLISPKQSKLEFEKILKELTQDKSRLQVLKTGAQKKASTLTWSNKAAELYSIYLNLNPAQ